MFEKIFTHQLKRSRKTVFYILLLIVATAFFVTSTNLYQNSTRNLQKAEETYSTLAVMELYGNVDKNGNLTEPNSEECVGYKSVAVKGYDLDKIIHASGVVDWDLRKKYGAYLENTPAMKDENATRADADVIRFRFIGDEPVTLPLVWEDEWSSVSYYESIPLEFEVLDSAAGCFVYDSHFACDGFGIFSKEQEAYREQIQKLNRSDDFESITLYPGVEYIVSTYSNNAWQREAGSDSLTLRQNEMGEKNKARFYPANMTYGAKDLAIDYSWEEEYLNFTMGAQAGQPFPLQRWEDVQSDPKMKAYFDGLWDAMKIQTCTFNVDLTNDVMSVPVAHLGGISLKEGRFITEEEYENGKKVCMVSDKLAEYQGWKLGGKLDVQFFEPQVILNRDDQNSFNHPIYNEKVEGFFDREEYEIVGIYAQNKVTGTSEIARSTLEMPWFTIYVPEKSVKNLPEKEDIVHGALFSLRLKNGSVDHFLEDIKKAGLMQKNEGQYHPTFTFYDQGYSLIAPGLSSMHSTAQLLLILSSVLMVISCILLAFFFAQTQKQNVGIFRMLGGSKGKSIAAVLVCAVLIAAAGAALGGVSGHFLAQKVGNHIMEENLAQNEKDSAYQAYVVKSSDTEQVKPTVQANPALSTVSTLSDALFPILTLVFVLLYVGKEPRELLPKTRE